MCKLMLNLLLSLVTITTTLLSTEVAAMPTSGSPHPSAGDGLLTDEIDAPTQSPADSPTVSYGVWRNMRPTESYLEDVSMLPSTFVVDCVSPDQKSEGWIVGSGGTILGYCNGVWDHFIAPTFNDLVSVQTISPTLAVAVGADGTFLAYQWKETEQRWEWIRYPIQPSYTEYLRSISLVPSDQPGVSYEGWTVGDNGAMARALAYPYYSGGITLTFNFVWEVVQPVVPNTILGAVQMLSPDNGWAVGGWRYAGPHSSVILHWDGNQWNVQEFGESALFGLYMLSPTDGWAVGEGGVILHYNGSSWSQVPSPTRQMLRAVYMVSPTEGWAMGHYGVILHYADGQWSLLSDLRTDPFDYRAVDFTSGTGWTVGSDEASGIGGVILRYDEAYQNWMAVSSPTVNHLHDVYTLDDNNAWAVGSYDELGGTILHWDGHYWQRIYQRDIPIPSANLYAVEMVGANDGWAMGDVLGSPPSSLILRYDGNRWAPTRFQSPINVAVSAVSMLNPDFGWAVGAGDRALLSYDNSNPPYSDQWIGIAACGGVPYYLRGVSVFSTTVNPTGDPYDAWAVGQEWSLPDVGGFLRRQPCAGSGNKWDWEQAAPTQACGGGTVQMQDIQVVSPTWGVAVGGNNNRAAIFGYEGIEWINTACDLSGSCQGGGTQPSQYNSTFTFLSRSAWYAGSWTPYRPLCQPWSLISHSEEGFYVMGMTIFPVNGTNIYHRPLNGIHMSSDTMGWAVGERGTILSYVYPNFVIQATPEARAIRPGTSTTFSVTVRSLGGIEPLVSLSVVTATLPTGITCDVEPGMIDPTTTATVTVQTSPSTPLGTYQLHIQGSATVHSGDYDVDVVRTAITSLSVVNDPIISVVPDHGPAGTVVTITGEEFGADPGVGNRSTPTHHVRIANVQLPDSAVTAWSDTQIVVVPPDSVTLWPQGPVYGPVVVRADGYDSDSLHNFLLECHVTALEPSQGMPGQQVVIHGTTFGQDPGYSLRSTYFEHVTLNDFQLPYTNVTGWSNNHITITIPSGATTGPVVVTANGYPSNDDVIFRLQQTFMPVMRRNY